MASTQPLDGAGRLRSEPIPLRGILTAAGATTAMVFGFGSIALTSVFIRPLEADFGWNRADVSLGYTLAAVGMALGGVFWGRLSDRVDARVLLAFGSAVMVAALASLSLASSIWHIYAASLALGALGFSCLYAPILSITALWFDRRRGLAMGIVTAGGALGQGLMPYAANLLIDSVGWRLAYAVLAGATLIAFAALMPAIRRPPGSAPAMAAQSGDWTLPKWRRLPVGLLSAAAFFCCACMGIPLVHLASFVTAICGSSDVGSASLLVAMLSGTVGRVCFGLLADRVGNLPAYALASLTQTACVAIYPVLETETSLLTLSAIFGFGFAGNMTCLILCVREFVPAAHFGRAIGIIQLTAWAGMGAGSYLGGAIHDGFASYAPAFLLASAAGFLNLATLAVLASSMRVKGAAAASS